MTKPTKAKKRITDMTFDHEGAHLALCSKSQGAANNWNKALIMKGHKFSPEMIQKMQSVQVEMSLPDFLEKFFYLWEDDAKALAVLMGYQAPIEIEDEQAEYMEDFDKWVEDRFESFAVIKSLHKAKNLPTALSKLTEDQYMSVLNDQVVIEKALTEFATGSKSEADTSATNVEKTKVEASASKTKTKKEKNMTQATPEMVEKSQLTVLEKAMEDQKVQLQKALDMVAQFEEAGKQAVIKSKTDAVNAVIKDEKQAAVLVKAALAMDTQEDFEALVQVIKSLVEQVEKSELFTEVGASGSAGETKADEHKVTQILKAKFSNK